MLKYKNSCFRISILALLLIIISISGFVYYRDNLYKSLNVDLKGYDIVYGKEVKLDNLIKKDGLSYTIIQDIDTKKLGRQDVLIEVKKDNVTKVVPVAVNVMDISEPEIKLKETSISITEGDSLNVRDYIESVVDDGDNLEYKESVSDGDLSYYTINTNLDTNTNGEYNVEVVAVDKANNKTVTNYTVTVNKKPEPVVQPQTTFQVPTVEPTLAPTPMTEPTQTAPVVAPPQEVSTETQTIPATVPMGQPQVVGDNTTMVNENLKTDHSINFIGIK